MSRSGPEDKALAEMANQRASLYGLLLFVLARLSDQNLLDAIRSEELEGILASSPWAKDPRFRAGLDKIRAACSNSRGKDDRTILTELAVDRTRLLRAPVGAGFKPPYEGLFKKDEAEGGCPLKVKTFYRQAGLLPDESVRESPDYLCLELDFMRLLCRREENQRRAGQAAAETVGCQERFLSQHLGSWLKEYCNQAQGQAATEFFQGIMAILDAFVAADLKYLQGLNAGK